MGIWVGFHTTDYGFLAVTFIFYLIFVPSIATTLMKIMYVSTGGMLIIGGVERMDEILHTPPCPSLRPRKTPAGMISFLKMYPSLMRARMPKPCPAFPSTRRKIRSRRSSVPRRRQKHHRTSHPRFFDVAEGSIRIGGVDVRDMKSEYLM